MTVGAAIAVAVALAIPTTAQADPPPVNHAPVAYAQTVAAYQGSAAAITLNGDDPDLNDGVSYDVVTGPTHGNLQGGIQAIHSYVPVSTYTGPDSFTFRVLDSHGLPSPVVTVTINVIAAVVVNRPPVAYNQSVSTPLNTALAIVLKGFDPDGDALGWVNTQPAHGTLTGSAPNLTYTPTPGYTGADSFTFKVDDGRLQSALATVTIAVNKPNTAPVANSLSIWTIQNRPVNLTLSGSDPDGDTFVFNTPSAPAHGTVSGTAPNLTYTPYRWFHGTDTFTFTVTDSHGAVSAPATVTIVVRGFKHRPVAYDQSVATGVRQPVKIHLNGWSGDHDNLDFIIVDYPNHGRLIKHGDDVIYVPNRHFRGYDSFDFIVRDEDGNTSRPATVDIKVKSYWDGHSSKL